MSRNKKCFIISAIIGITSIIILYNVLNSSVNIELHFTPLLPNEINDLDLLLLDRNDYQSLLNISFSFTILKPICSIRIDMAPFLLILVHSSTDHFEKRQMIRSTWGASSTSVRVAFLVGQSLHEDVNQNLKVESLQNNDIIQGSFIDSYVNITYKHTMGMKYFIYHCSNAKYVLKVDDDMLVNTPKLVKFLSEKISPNGARNMILCTTVVNALAVRTFRSKWRISYEEYPHRFFPPFCRGMAIIYSPDVLFNLYKRAQRNKKYVRLDDVFYTGMTAQSIGYKEHSDITPLISFDYKETGSNVYVPKNLKSYLFVGSELSEKDIFKLWHLLKRPDL